MHKKALQCDREYERIFPTERQLMPQAKSSQFVFDPCLLHPLLLWCGLTATLRGLRFFCGFADESGELREFQRRFDSVKEGLYDSRPSALGR
ncbi:MAG: hypothetical protein OEL20_07065 [Sulfuritalea sp.]|nr:hypothetical protein [Sulfuritalea sp.]